MVRSELNQKSYIYPKEEGKGETKEGKKGKCKNGRSIERVKD